MCTFVGMERATGSICRIFGNSAQLATSRSGNKFDENKKVRGNLYT